MIVTAFSLAYWKLGTFIEAIEQLQIKKPQEKIYFPRVVNLTIYRVFRNNFVLSLSTSTVTLIDYSHSYWLAIF